MPTSRREFVKWVTASGIAVTLSRLASAEETPFEARETLPRCAQRRLAVRDGTLGKFGAATGPVTATDYGAYRFTRVAGATPEAPDIYSPRAEGWVSPPRVANTDRPDWLPSPGPGDHAYA